MRGWTCLVYHYRSPYSIFFNQIKLFLIMAITFTYTGSEALEMLKTHFPQTWQQELNEGRSFLKSMMRLYNLDAMEAYQKYIKYCGTREKAISTLAALHLMNQQVTIGRKIKELQVMQQQYAAQSVALEGSQITSYQDKMMLRQHYSEKKNEIQCKLEELIDSLPVFGAETVKVQLNIFEN